MDWKTVLPRMLIGLVLLLLVIWFGRHAAHDIKAMESWISGHGVSGWFVFIGMVVVFTSVFVPQSVLAIAGGTLFGIVGGTILTFVGAVLTAAVNFVVANGLMQARIQKMLDKHPKLQAIQRVAIRKGLRLQLLLRLAPLNPVTVSYALGASGVRFSTFMFATIGLLPAVFVGVYFGYMASHVTKVAGKASEHSTLHTVITIVGFILVLVVMICITRFTTKAIADAENELSEDAAPEN